MERKHSRRGNDKPQPLDKNMIGRPTNFAHVSHFSYTLNDRFVECEVSGDPAGVRANERPAQAEEEETEGQEDEEEEEEEKRGGGGGGGGGEEEGGEEGEEEVLPIPPLSPDTSRRNSRRISKDMISFPTNFRHVLHINPTTADPERLSLLLKTSGVLEQETEYEEEEEEEEEEWPPEDPPLGEVPEEAPRGTEGPLKAPKTHRPSSRVRKSMISFPTNFQHVDHISAGERIYAPDSPPPQIPPDFPPPQIPPEPDPGAEDGSKGLQNMYEHNQHSCETSTSSTTYSKIDFNTSSDHTTASYDTNKGSKEGFYDTIKGSKGHQNTYKYNTETSTTMSYTNKIDFNPTTDPTTASYVTNIPVTYSSPLPVPVLPINSFPSPLLHPTPPLSAPPYTTHREKLSSWSGSQSEADVCNSRSDETDFDSSLAQFRIPPPPPSPHQNGGDTAKSSCLPELWKWHESGKERTAKEGNRRRGREREKEGRREGEKERRTPSLPPSLPHISPPSQEPPPPPPPSGRLRKAMIGPPTNFQHVSHVGFGGLGSED